MPGLSPIRPRTPQRFLWELSKALILDAAVIMFTGIAAAGILAGFLYMCFYLFREYGLPRKHLDEWERKNTQDDERQI